MIVETNHVRPIANATTVDSIIEYQTHSTDFSIIKTKNNARGAETPRTRTIVITKTGSPLPSPCSTLPVVIPIAINGYANAKICKKLMI